MKIIKYIILPAVIIIMLIFTVTNSEGLNYTYYNWTTTDGNIVSGQGTNSIVVDKNGTYQVKATPNITGIITYLCPVIQSIQITDLQEFLNEKNCDLSSPEFEFASQFDLLPNPANEVVAVSSKNNQKIQVRK